MSKEKRKPRSSSRNLVVNAYTKEISNHPGYFTNSQRTISTNGLSKSYSPEKYETRGRGNPNAGGTGSLKKSVSFSDDETEKVKDSKFNSTADDALDAEVANSFLNTDETQLREELQKILNGSTMGRDFDGKSRTGSDPQWFVNPVHKDRLDFPMHQTASMPERSASPLNRSSGNLGAAIAAKHIARERLVTPPSTNLKDQVQMRRLDRYAEEFFPVTLGASFSVRASLASPPPKSKTVSPPAKGLPSPGEPWRPISPRKKRPKSPMMEDVKRDVDKMYLMSSVAPTIGSSSILLTTPYQHDLAKLRMERLRIEEQQMLEVKRIQELERIRGPVPKWYELKTPDFHYEAHKNTELMKSSDSWQDLMDYRKDLTAASQEYRRTYLTQ